ncbi:hypothetical protein FRC11_003648, partial [Ceratobasidium sp. 423]
MSTRNLHKLKSSIKTWVIPAGRRWPYLCLLNQTLGASLDRGWSQARILWDVVGEFIKCINIFETQAKERKGYGKMRRSLEENFHKIQQCCNQNSPPEITGAVQGLCQSIERELSNMRAKEERSQEPEVPNTKLEKKEDDVLECYRRVQKYFQCITFNISVQQITDLTYK